MRAALTTLAAVVVLLTGAHAGAVRSRKAAGRPSRRRDDQRQAREARLSIPALGLSELRVVAYAGTPDDGPGTVIQNDGSAASPHGTADWSAPAASATT